MLLVPALASAAMFVVLIALGVWQLHRREWKLAILADIDTAEASPPAPLGPNPRPYTRIVVNGTLRPGPVALYSLDIRLNRQGAQLIQPLERPGQETVLVDRGWVPEGTGPYPQPPGPIVGYVRLPVEPGSFTPADDVPGLHFYNLDPAKIGAALGIAHVAPFVVVALGDGEGLPQAATELPRPPNDHLNYALTWFGLAFSLVVVFAAAARKVLRT